MLKNKKYILSMTLVLVIVFGTLLNVSAAPSSWAENFVKAMLLEGLASDEMLDSSKMQQAITREEFAELTVILFAKAKNQTVEEQVEWNPFADSDNKMVAKAFNIGIVSGTGNDSNDRKLFSPSSLVTRQEIAVMLVRELKLLDIDTTQKYDLNYSDEDTISSWAYDAVAFASENDILSGVGDNNVAPKSNATREQALVLIHRIASKYGWVDNQYTSDQFNQSNSSQTYGFTVPNNDASELVVFKQSSGLKFLISNMVDSYKPDIKQQQADLISILYQSEIVKYDALKILFEMIQDGYDPISKTFKSADTLYINLSNGNTSTTPIEEPYISITIDNQIIIEYIK